jgi:glycosyltransferase involved in cell wall biosynthesis
LELTFFGTFIGLQGVDVLAQAILQYEGPPVLWRLIGEGPMRAECEALLASLRVEGQGAGVSFEPWGPLHELPARLASSDAILGIFGSSAKARRVIPNKVYQGLAIGRPVITASTPAYADHMRSSDDSGLFWAMPGDPASIQAAVHRLHSQRDTLQGFGQAAQDTYQAYFSNLVIMRALSLMLATIRQ